MSDDESQLYFSDEFTSNSSFVLIPELVNTHNLDDQEVLNLYRIFENEHPGMLISMITSNGLKEVLNIINSHCTNPLDADSLKLRRKAIGKLFYKESGNVDLTNTQEKFVIENPQLFKILLPLVGLSIAVVNNRTDLIRPILLEMSKREPNLIHKIVEAVDHPERIKESVTVNMKDTEEEIEVPQFDAKKLAAGFWFYQEYLVKVLLSILEKFTRTYYYKYQLFLKKCKNKFGHYSNKISSIWEMIVMQLKK